MLKTSECVSPQHPDKICDRISDAILDACLKKDHESRCAIEVMGGHGEVFILGEITTPNALGPSYDEVFEIVKRIAGPNLKVKTNVVTQSYEIANGIDQGGAGDQGIVIGYACRENEAMIPHEHYLAKSLCNFLYSFNPDDGKTQVSLDENNKIETIVASWRGVARVELEKLVRTWLSSFVNKYSDKETAEPELLCNPAGDWDIGGFEADAGLTGRKIVCDAYGPRVPVGGGAFSGKDATKVDRSGAYRARKLAIDILNEHEDHQEVLVRVAYAIGKAEPVQVIAELKKAGCFISYHDVTEKYAKMLSPAAMINDLDLRKPIYESVASWGSFGNQNFSWDQN